MIADNQDLEVGVYAESKSLMALSPMTAYVGSATRSTKLRSAQNKPGYQQHLRSGSWSMQRGSETITGITKGVIGDPAPVESLDLNDNLLVDTVVIYERHAGQNWKVRLITNARSNSVNSSA